MKIEESPKPRRTREQLLVDLRKKRYITHEDLDDEEKALETELKSLGDDDQPPYRVH